MTEPTAGCAARPPIATSSMLTPRSCANRSTASIRSKSAAARRSGREASRVPSGAASPRRYLPVSSPDASGKNGSSPTPTCSHAGTRSASTSRFSREYSFCAETNGVRPAVRAVQSASTTCQPVKFELPT